MLDKIKSELEMIKKEKIQAIARYNAILGAESILLKIISEAEKGEAECQSKQP